MALLAKKGVPVVHINYTDRLHARYDFPADPGADSTPGSGPMFGSAVHSLGLVAGLLVALLVVFFVTIRIDMRHYLHRRGEANQMV